MTFDSAALDDPVTVQILAELQNDARISIAELGRRISLSAPAVAERIRRLEEAGIITGYSARVDASRVGYGVLAFIRLAPFEHHLRQHDEINRHLQETPEVLECHHVLGDDCYILKVAVRDTAHLEQLLEGLVRLGRTTTSVVMSTPVAHRSVLPAGADPPHIHIGGSFA